MITINVAVLMSGLVKVGILLSLVLGSFVVGFFIGKEEGRRMR